MSALVTKTIAQMKTRLIKRTMISCQRDRRVARLVRVLGWGILTLSYLANQASRAQPASFAWAKSLTATGGATRAPKDVAIDGADHAFVAYEGGTWSGGAFFPSGGVPIHAVNKFDSQGELAWEQTLQTTGGTWGIGATTDGGCEVVGYTADGLFKDLAVTPDGNGEVFLARYSAGGDLVSLRLTVWGLTRNVYIHGVKLDTLGNCYVAASYSGTPSLGGAALPPLPPGRYAAATAKFRPDGSLAWVSAVKGASFQNGGVNGPFNYIAVDSTGNVFAVVTSQGDSVAVGETTASGSPCFVVKYDQKGNVAWAHALATEEPGQFGFGAAPAVAVDRDGNAFTLVKLNRPQDPDQLSRRNVWSLAKWSAAGDLSWRRTYDAGEAGDYWVDPKGLTVDPAGDCLVTVNFMRGPLMVGNASFGDPSQTYNFAILKYSPSGDLRWGLAPEPGGEVIPMGMAADANGGSWICSMAWEPVKFGDTVLTPLTGQFEPFLTRVIDRGITVAAPVLQVVRTASGLVLSWSGTATGYSLETTASLTNPTNWAGLLDSGALSNTTSVQVGLTNASAFFRLRKQ